MFLKFCSPEFILILLGIIGLMCLPVQGAQREIRFDDGKSNFSTVIGLFRDNGASYHQRQDFTLRNLQNIKDVKVRLHVHIGSKIEPAPGQTDVKVAVRVNGGQWHWMDLSSFRDDSSRWLEIPVPLSEWHEGLNRVETNSTVGSFGNRNERTLDILASSSGTLRQRSWHTFDFSSYVHQPDRNWGIRLLIDEVPLPSCEVKTARIMPEKASATVSEPAQFYVEAFDADGRQVDPGDIRWSASSGSIDEFGLYTPQANVPATITAMLGSLTATAECEVGLKRPAGVAEPAGPQRLRKKLEPGQLDLNGTWHFRLDPKGVGEAERWQESPELDGWGSIHVPGNWQAQGWGLDYHGTSWYKRSFTIPQSYRGKEVWIGFDAAATQARVWVNGKLAGEHIGNWSPFHLRVTDLLDPLGDNELVVMVKEIPSHFSAGFLSVIAPHFGGIWQSVYAYATGSLRIDDVWVLPRLSSSQAVVETAIGGRGGNCSVTCVVTAPDGSIVARREQTLVRALEGADRKVVMSVLIPEPKVWSPDTPALYTAKVELSEGGEVSDSREIRFGMRDVSRSGRHLLLNGKPLFVRGVLHWGYYPHLISVDPSEEQIRKEFADLKAAGFNLVKPCLIVFPKRYYEIADEMGMLIWQEYPTWLTFPRAADDAPHEEVVREFEEWFIFDRNHPSIILRDLTCEAPDMSRDLTRRIYNMGKALTGGALIEDNSAYMNQVYTDWYDCHIYSELDDFLPRWQRDMLPAIKNSKEPKPFLPGEDNDADTYRDTKAVAQALSRDGKVPWWLQRDWTYQAQTKAESGVFARLGESWRSEIVKRQRLHSLALRKGLNEAYRRQPEFAGYVMTHIRDNMHTRPGFFDDLDNPKWAPEEWRRFTGDRVLLLDSPSPSHCLPLGQPVELKIALSNYGEPLKDVPLRWSLLDGRKSVTSGEAKVSLDAGEVDAVLAFSLLAVSGDGARSCLLVAELGDKDSITTNEWPIWFIPAPGTPSGNPFYVYSAADSSGLASDLPYVPVARVAPSPDGSGWKDAATNAAVPAPSSTGPVLVTDTLDAPVKKALREGARVLFIARDDDFTIPRRDVPFWREMAIWLPEGHAALGDFPHESFIDRQFYDLTQRRPFDCSSFRDEIDPIVWGVNSRYMNGAVLADYIFQGNVGSGKLLGCSFRVRGSIAGRYMLSRLCRYAAGDAFAPAGPGEGKLAEILK